MQDERLYDEKELEKSWLISYSDLFTLLFVIIIIVAASSSSQIQSKIEQSKKAEEAEKQSIQEAAKSRDILQIQKLELQREIAQLEGKRKSLVENIREMKADEKIADPNWETAKAQLAVALQEMNVHFEETSEGLMIRFPEKVMYASGSADLSDKGKQAVTNVAKVLQRFTYKVRIEGYTDDVPISNSQFRSNWELSSARAISVMRELVDSNGLPASRFMVAGWGEYHPIVDNANAENRAMNRRVEMLILAEQE
ncbi:OmpA/MotB family protein [Brevibacillus sp. SYSU BS000544]|uniref:OmpA/MotB family protein n=1 Tax=Brevibacillus sp. SYSU BS000544 TaxID=3416443 RepID=UPI003CE4AE0A